MTNLSELSKPVAWTDERGNLCTTRNKERGLESRYHQDYEKYTTPFYSQEYVSALLARIEELEATEIKPEGMRLMSEAIGAHGYIVGCLVQGRPDLALEESRKWVDAFSQAAELINNG